MISLNWVKDYIDIKNENPVELANKITKAGINVEKVNVFNRFSAILFTGFRFYAFFFCIYKAYTISLHKTLKITL